MTEEELAELARLARATAIYEVAGLDDAKARDDVFIACGDDGAQTYFTVPARRITCSKDALVQLAFDLDHIYWTIPDGVIVEFDEAVNAARDDGGIGRHRIVEGVWLHDTLEGSALAQRVRDVLSGVRPGLWPNGSSPEGKPLQEDDLLDLLGEERGDGPAFALVRAAVRRCRAGASLAFTSRARSQIARFLDVRDERTRVAASAALIDIAAPAAVVAAVMEVAGGFTERWDRRAVVLIGDLARRDEPAAWDAVDRLASQAGWIERLGPWIFVDWTEFDERYTDPEIFRAELPLVRGRKRVRTLESVLLPAG